MEANEVAILFLVETWLHPRSPIPALPSTPGYARHDAINRSVHERARRGKGGVSVLYATRAMGLNGVTVSPCADGRWLVLSTTAVVVAGAYLNPSLSPTAFEAVLDRLRGEVCAANRGVVPTVVVGDFNARLGAITGDHAQNDRKAAITGFARSSKLTLLNASIASRDDRWTWDTAQGRSVVDLALASWGSSHLLRILPPPLPTPHRAVVVTATLSVALQPRDADRWNWARRRLARDVDGRCRAALLPAMAHAAALWHALGRRLDDEVTSAAAGPFLAQAAVDETYEATALALREALTGIACWPPEMALRAPLHSPHMDWAVAGTLPIGFMMAKTKAALKAAGQAAAVADVTPTLDAFGAFYADLFRADDNTPREPFSAHRKPIGAVDIHEGRAFSVEALQRVIERAQWKKAIGPDNLPADVFKCCPEESAKVLHSMFSALWAHQLAPTCWNKAFMTPIPKRGQDLSDVANWRGIALQCHLKKLYEVCILQLMRTRGWLRLDMRQMGFRHSTGASDAVMIVDEMTRRYASTRRPLTAVLLDIRKAYDRTCRAYIWRKLRARGVPAHVLGVLQSLMDRCQVVVQLNGQRAAPVDVAVGVPQGDVLSPSMFNLLVDELPARLEAVGRRLGGVPRYAGCDVPVVMYADDQTILHWDRSVLQALLDEAQAYADEHGYQYNVRKSVVSQPVAIQEQAPLLIAGEPIAVGATVPLLGVLMANGAVDHELQIADRMGQAERAMFGLLQIGALTPLALPLDRQAQLIKAFGRSRIEYGMAITRHKAATLAAIDKLVWRHVAYCLGSGRGNVAMARLVGMPPALSRQTKLRSRFRQRMEHVVDRPEAAHLLAPRAFRHADRDPASKLRKDDANCVALAQARATLTRWMGDYRAASSLPGSRLSRLPSARGLQSMRRLATAAAQRATTWGAYERSSKLLRIQTQDATRAHPVATLPGADPYELARWLTNLVPGAQYPCSGCDGQYPISRYHMTRCIDVPGALGEFFSQEQHAGTWTAPTTPSTRKSWRWSRRS